MVPTKYYSYGDVYYYVWHLDQISAELVRSISYEALGILKILKERHVVHNNIKFENFLVDSINPLKILITDFRHAQVLKEGEKSKSKGVTPIFEAPEVLENLDHDYSSDVWSLGIDIYLSLFLELPFDIKRGDDENIILQKIKTNKLVNLNDKASDDAWECITKILTLNPEDRITASDALKLNWFIPEVNKEKFSPLSSNLSANIDLGDD